MNTATFSLSSQQHPVVFVSRAKETVSDILDRKLTSRYSALTGLLRGSNNPHEMEAIFDFMDELLQIMDDGSLQDKLRMLRRADALLQTK